jgi:hypothetical protein
MKAQRISSRNAAHQLYVTAAAIAHDTHEGIVMFTHMRHAAARFSARVAFKIEEAADDTERREIACIYIAGKGTPPERTWHAPARRTDPTLILTFLLAAAVCAMGILAIHALSIEGLTR